MKKKLLVPVLCLIVVAAAVVVVLGATGEKTVPLSLSDFYNGEEYVYASTAWGMSADETEKALPVRMIADTSRGNANGVDFYTAKKHFALDGYEAELTIELEQKNLNIVKFTFETDDSYQTWFDTQLSALIALYGDDYICHQNSNAQYESSIYKWETEDSSLQFILMTGEKIKPAITLGVTKK